MDCCLFKSLKEYCFMIPFHNETLVGKFMISKDHRFGNKPFVDLSVKFLSPIAHKFDLGDFDAVIPTHNYKTQTCVLNACKQFIVEYIRDFGDED